MNYISQNIRHLRKLRKLTQEEFSKELNITKSRIGSYEEGRSEPSIETLIELSNFFKLPVDVLPVDVLIKNNLSSATEASFMEIGNQRVLFPIMDEAD